MISVFSSRFQIWKTIKIGTGIKDADGFCEAIEKAKMCISKWRHNEFVESHFDVAAEEQELDLVLISLANLGFTEPVRSLSPIYERAGKFGLDLCPQEVGPQLRLQYRDQPDGESISVAMEPIRYPVFGRYVFVVHCADSVLYLHCFYGYDRPIGGGTQWYPDSLFVFVSPRK